MSYTEFSTENANYILQLGNHITENKHDINMFNGIDALVIETGNNSLEDMIRIRGIPQMNKPIEYCKYKSIPIFSVDIGPNFNGFLRTIASMVLTFPLDFRCNYYAFKEEKINNTFKRLHADFNFLAQHPASEGRNAINARKIEEFVVPMLVKVLNKERPKIGMVFGAGHTGLEYDLKSKKRRDFTIWNYRNFNFGKYAGFYKEKLNIVSMAQYNIVWGKPLGWIFVKYKTVCTKKFL